MSKREISDSLNEIRFLASIRHQNIVGFLEAFLGIWEYKTTSHLAFPLTHQNPDSTIHQQRTMRLSCASLWNTVVVEI